MLLSTLRKILKQMWPFVLQRWCIHTSIRNTSQILQSHQKHKEVPMSVYPMQSECEHVDIHLWYLLPHRNHYYKILTKNQRIRHLRQMRTEGNKNGCEVITLNYVDHKMSFTIMKLNIITSIFCSRFCCGIIIFMSTMNSVKNAHFNFKNNNNLLAEYYCNFCIFSANKNK